MNKIIILLIAVLAIQNLCYSSNSDYTTPKPVRYSTQQGMFRVEKTIYASDQELDMIKKMREAEFKERFPNGVLPTAIPPQVTQTEITTNTETTEQQTNKSLKSRFINATKEVGKELLLGL